MRHTPCPFCSGNHGTELICPETGHPIPSSLIFPNAPIDTLWLLTVGFSEHGKTSFLSMLIQLIEQICNIVPKMYARPLDDHTRNIIREMRSQVLENRNTEKTAPEELFRPLLMDVMNIDLFGSKRIIAYDAPGEEFDSFESIKLDAYSKLLRRVSTVWLVVSMHKLREDHDGRTITELFNVYYSKMQQAGINLRGWNVIVVYTMGDKEFEDSHIADYLHNDPLKFSANKELQDISIDFRHYLEKMEAMSEYLKFYTHHKVRQGRAFTRMIEEEGMNLTFTINSALGFDPDANNKLSYEISSMRVIDAFFWALKLDKQSSLMQIHLFVDQTVEVDESFYALLSSLQELLSQIGVVTLTWVRDLYTHHKPSLLGPILKFLEPNSEIILICRQEMLDMADFLATSYARRIFLLETGTSIRWPRRSPLTQEHFPHIRQQLIDRRRLCQP